MTSLAVFMVLHLLLTLSPPLFGQGRRLVRADESLIQIECHNAEVPSTCIQCLTSDGRAENADKVGIATIVVDCLQNHANTLAGNMSSLASGTKDRGMKNVFLKCGQGFSSAEKALSSSTLSLKNGKYENAEKFVGEALEHELTCQKNVASYKDQIPERVAYEMRIYEELSEAARRIFERL
ncbi:Pectinesterase inhibitor [Morella rubra]|uniref:Pectinesterase inhibitor n=1 Tax=Morella rubra TaxID=262757 RepID=A0A6A1VVG2_9ROSI|nr:Pectinesterase inhibitor [Morella rubra]